MHARPSCEPGVVLKGQGKCFARCRSRQRTQTEYSADIRTQRECWREKISLVGAEPIGVRVRPTRWPERGRGYGFLRAEFRVREPS